MRRILIIVVAVVMMSARVSDAQPTTAPATIDLRDGWTPLEEGKAQGTAQADATHPSDSRPHLLHITVTKMAGPGEGRAGATNSTPIDVREGQWIDVSFAAVNERGSVGLVFSLEGADGKVLARTTLPEIGRRGRGPPDPNAPTTATAVAWRDYRVALHARGSDPLAHLVITPIDSTSVWLDGVTLSWR